MKAKLARGMAYVSLFPVLAYLELREKFEHTDWKW